MRQHARRSKQSLDMQRGAPAANRPKIDKARRQQMERHGFGQTHEVDNQAPPLADYNLFASDVALSAALERDGAAWHRDALLRHGAALSTPQTLALAELANRHTPELFTHSPRGERID